MRKSSLRLILPLLPLCMALNASEKTEHEFAQSQWTFQGMANTAVTGEAFYGEFSSLPASLVSKPLNPPDQTRSDSELYQPETGFDGTYEPWSVHQKILQQLRDYAAAFHSG